MKLRNLKQFIGQHRLELIIVLILLAGTAILHGWNMFNYPYLENDEATYASQGWQFIKNGQLAAYTYYYDHAPAGWIFMSIWFFLTVKLIPLFDSILTSGRVFMLLIHVASAALLYLIARKITQSKYVSTLAVIIYAASPLVMYFQRRILLDSIMLFWVLLAVYLILYSKNRLHFYLLSAAAFGIAVLTKENAIFFALPLLYALHQQVHKSHRRHAFSLWIGTAGIVIFLYVLYALLKNEFFPPGTLLGGSSDHVSLLKTLNDQLGRGGFHFPWDKAGDLYNSAIDWLEKDPVLIITGAFSVIVSAIIAVKDKTYRLPVLLSGAMLIFLLRGKLVINLYVIPLLPFYALNIAMVINYLSKHISTRQLRQVFLVLVLLIFSANYLGLSDDYLRVDEVSNQTQAVKWIEQNIPKDKHIAIDNYAYPSLKINDSYVNADYVYKIEYDKSIREKINADWRNIDYILLTHEIVRRIKIGELPTVKEALEHSDRVASFREGSTSYIDLDEYISTNGDWADVYKVKSRDQIVLQDSWQSYKESFVKSYGQVVDPSQDITTSEGQAYGMLRAVIANDKDTFEGIRLWTDDHMRYRSDDKLYSWKFSKNAQGEYVLADANTATDGDLDIAYALYVAGQKWHSTLYTNEAKIMANDIWRKEIKTVNGRLYLASSASTETTDILVNPSYFSPYYYRLFKQITPEHDWDKLINDTYTTLNEMQASSNVGLVQNWYIVDASGKYVSATSKVGQGSDDYGYDAFRTSWRLGLDVANTSDQRAVDFLHKQAEFFQSEWSKNKAVYATYTMQGVATVPYDDISTVGGAIFALKYGGNSSLANTIYQERIMSKYDDATATWGDPTNYYNQNWGWLTSALVHDDPTLINKSLLKQTSTVTSR